MKPISYRREIGNAERICASEPHRVLLNFNFLYSFLEERGQWVRPKEMQVWLREKWLGIITRILSGLVEEGILLNCHRYQLLIYFLSPVNPEYSLEGRHWSRSSSTLATWYEQLTRWKRPSCWERLRAGGEGEDRGWDGWMASPTQWTWVWANSRRCEGQGSRVCCHPLVHKELEKT